MEKPQDPKSTKLDQIKLIRKRYVMGTWIKATLPWSKVHHCIIIIIIDDDDDHHH